jgi:hypothetical protein
VASCIWIDRYNILEKLAATIFGLLLDSPKMEAPMYRTTWCHIPEDSNINIYTCENFKSHILYSNMNHSYNKIFWQNNIHYRSPPFTHVTWSTEIKKSVTHWDSNDNSVQWNLYLSFPDNSFSQIRPSISMVPERIYFNYGSRIYCFPTSTVSFSDPQRKQWIVVSLYFRQHNVNKVFPSYL